MSSAYGLCRWSILLAVIVSLLGRTEMTSAKALGVQNGYWSTLDDISKRNTWWSKKSLDSSSDYQSRQSDSTMSAESTLEEPTADLFIDQASSLYDCYVETCMPEFVHCAKRSRRNEESYRRCKFSHRVCAAGCYLSLTSTSPQAIADRLSD